MIFGATDNLARDLNIQLRNWFPNHRKLRAAKVLRVMRMAQFFKLKAVNTMPTLKSETERIVFLIIDIVNAVSIESSISVHLSRLLQNEINMCVTSDLDLYSRLEGTRAPEQSQSKLTTSNNSAAASPSRLRMLRSRLFLSLRLLKYPFRLRVQDGSWCKILIGQVSAVRSNQFISMSQLLLESASRLRLLACPLVCLIVAGCSALDFTTAKSSSGSEFFKISSEQFSVEAVGTDEPNDIVARINVPLPMRSKFVLRRTTHSSGLKQVLDMGVSESFTDYHLQPLETYIYELGSFDNGKFVPEIVRSLTIPQDFVVREHTEIPAQANHKFQPFRIFIRDHGVLLTKGQSLKIETTEIISDNGTIETFDPAQPAPLNTRGRSGGQLAISTGKLSGHLTVAMRGETGGSGTPGFPGVDQNGTDGTGPTSGTSGGQGAPGGNSGVLHLTIQNFKKDDLKILIEPGIGGAGGSGGRNGEGNGGGYASAGLKGYDGQPDPQSEDWR